jgi:hypothetical protein
MNDAKQKKAYSLGFIRNDFSDDAYLRFRRFFDREHTARQLRLCLVLSSAAFLTALALNFGLPIRASNAGVETQIRSSEAPIGRLVNVEAR